MIFFILKSNQYLSAEDNKGIVVIITGTSSAGKSSIVKELQKIYGSSYLVVKSDDYVDTLNEQSIPDQNQPQEIISEFWTKFYDDFYVGIKKLSDSGNNVLVDAVRFDDDHERYCNILKGRKVIKILIYCPLDLIFEHVNQRNKSDDIKEQRIAFCSIDQFPHSYKLAQFEDELVIDRISSVALFNTLIKAKKECESLLKDLPEEVSKERARSNEVCFNNFINEFKLNELKEVILVSKFPYNLIINSSKSSIIEIAKQIQNYLNK